MHQAAWRNTVRRGLFILNPPAHINDSAPVVCHRGDVHINSSHTRKRRSTRVEHRWVGRTEGKERRQKNVEQKRCRLSSSFLLFIISKTRQTTNLSRGHLWRKAVMPHCHCKSIQKCETGEEKQQTCWLAVIIHSPLLHCQNVTHGVNPKWSWEWSFLELVAFWPLGDWHKKIHRLFFFFLIQSVCKRRNE